MPAASMEAQRDSRRRTEFQLYAMQTKTPSLMVFCDDVAHMTQKVGKEQTDDYRIACTPRIAGELKKGADDKRKKRKVTMGSRLVSHASTNIAQRCLTSLIGREAVFPPWYEPCIHTSDTFVYTN